MKEEVLQPQNFTSKIRNVDFETFDKSEINKFSVLKVNRREIYDIETERPMVGGVLDTRLGLSAPGGYCETCNKTLQECDGHFGNVDLAFPVFHPGFFKNLVKILQAICKRCARILMNEERIFKYRINEKNIFNDPKMLIEAKKASICPHCAFNNPIVKKGVGLKLIFSGCDLNPITVKNLLYKIQDHDLLHDNKSKRPLTTQFNDVLSCYIVDKILVPPPNIRPSVKTEEFGSNEDSLTIKLSEIIQLSTTLVSSLGTSAMNIILHDWELLNETYNAYICASNIRSLLCRLKGKHGRFRNNLSGKRADFTARTVISPDPMLSIEQVGIPLHIAKILTVGEKANEGNIERLIKHVLNGQKYPGANYVISRDKKRLSTQYRQKVFIGDIVERHLCDGDRVLFNRQPSLHRLSILSHLVKIVPNKTFCFNVSVCAPYGADFDGDEMNVHVPQTLLAQAECAIMKVKKNLRTPKDGSLIIMPNQDFVTSVYLFGTEFFDKVTFCQYLCEISKTLKTESIFNRMKPAILRPKRIYTGKQLLKILFPEYEQNSLINKKQLKGLLSRLTSDQIVRIENSVARVSAKYIGEKGFSFGPDDLIYKNVDGKKLDNVIDNALDQIDTSNVAELGSIRDQIAKTIKLKTDNSALVMAESGSKGSKINITQMIALVGQQVINGQLVPLSFGRRTLPHFGYENETDEHTIKNLPQSRGFIKNSFYTGLNPQEFFFHAISGREGLVDTAVKTAETGYLQRKLMKALEDLKLCSDGSIRGANCIVKFPDPNSSHFKKGFVPGDAVGAIAAQSIGEPATQMTLKTFHFAGVSSMSITLGVPRLKEIINASPCSTPIVKITGLKKTLSEMRKINDQIQPLYLENIIEKIEIKVANFACADLFLCPKYVKKSSQKNFILEQAKKALERRYKREIFCQPESLRLFFPIEDNLIAELTDFKLQVGKIFVGGIKSISKTTFNNTDESADLNIDEPEFEILAEGTGLIDILGLENVASAVTNDVLEMSQVLGIEAAHSSIVQEIHFTLQSHGIEINTDHIVLLADMMCFKGHICGINRFGITKFKSNTLMLASFEQTGDHLFEAARTNKCDSISGISDSIILGNSIPLGTGDIKILQDYGQG